MKACLTSRVRARTFVFFAQVWPYAHLVGPVGRDRARRVHSGRLHATRQGEADRGVDSVKRQSQTFTPFFLFIAVMFFASVEMTDLL